MSKMHAGLAKSCISSSQVEAIKGAASLTCVVHVQDLEYPQMHRLMLHPCVSSEERSINCGQYLSATAILRFQSFFTQKRVVASYTFEVYLHDCQPSLPPLPHSTYTISEILSAANYAAQHAGCICRAPWALGVYSNV